MASPHTMIEEHTIVPFMGKFFFVQEMEVSLSFGQEAVVKHIVLSQVEGMEMEEEDAK